MPKILFIFAALNGALAVILGAFGAHALKQSLSIAQLATWQTAVQYHFIHVLALLALSLCIQRLNATRISTISGIAFIVGIIFFCGSLYGLALGGPKWLGPITPLGGLAFIIGWLALGVYGAKAFAKR